MLLHGSTSLKYWFRTLCASGFCKTFLATKVAAKSNTSPGSEDMSFGHRRWDQRWFQHAPPWKLWVRALTDWFYVFWCILMFHFRFRKSKCGSAERADVRGVAWDARRRLLACSPSLDFHCLPSLVLWNGMWNFAVQGKGTFWERDANLIEQLEHLYHVSFTDVPVCSVCLLVFGSQCHHVGPRGQWTVWRCHRAASPHLALQVNVVAGRWSRSHVIRYKRDQKGVAMCGLKMGHTWASFGNGHSWTFFAENRPDSGEIWTSIQRCWYWCDH